MTHHASLFRRDGGPRIGFVSLRRVALGAVIALLAATCGGASAPSAPVSTIEEPTGPPSAEAGLPAPVRLAPLPPQGLVIGRPSSVELVDLGGRVLDRLAGFHLAYDWAVPGPVVLKSHRAFYLLDVAAHVLRPLESRDAAFRAAPQFQEGVDPVAERYLDVERPVDALPASGFWTFALPSPDGNTLLAEWSGECENQTAFFVKADGSNPRPVTGQPGLRTAPSSSVIGWAADGAAQVFLGPGGPCGSGDALAGVYRFVGVGDGELMVPMPDPQGVRMWGTA